MDTQGVDPVREYRRDVHATMWLGVIVGLVLVLVGLFFGDWFTIVGSLIVILVAVRYWTTELTPNRLIAERMEERRRTASQNPRRSQ